MKKTIISALLVSVAICANAQNMDDALTFSENHYEGTARSMALGNAMTALGGDLGSIGINPAGSAVSNFSQFTITPSISMSAMTSSYSPDVYTDHYGAVEASRTKFTMPNIGFNFVWDTYRKHGLKSMAFGFISNTTRNYNSNMSSWGENGNSSMFQTYAYDAWGYTPDMLNSFSSSAPWDYSVAYQSGLISKVSGTDDYVGVTEIVTGLPDGSLDFKVPGILEQGYDRRTAGTKQDIVMNFGMNFDDRLFLGVNLGMPTFEYALDEGYRETPVNPEEFSFDYDDMGTVFLSEARKDYSYRASATGIYAKFGIIWLPFKGLRLGAAYQTPTQFEIEEKYQVSGSTVIMRGQGGTRDYYDAQSPVGEYSYYLYAPSRFNVGAAYTIGRSALVSVDYERANYGRMKYDDLPYDGTYVNGDFPKTNEYMREHGAAQSMLRAGVEFKPVQAFAIRGGYTQMSNSVVDFKAATRSYAFGVGYSSPGSFFMDYVVRMTNHPDSFFSPYTDCISDSCEYTPEIRATKTTFDIALTLGFRF